MKKSILIPILLFVAIHSNAQKKLDSLRHAVLKPRTSLFPKDVVRLLDLSTQMFTYKTIQIYQNSEPDSIRMPFDTYLDTSEFKRFVDSLEKRKLLPSTRFRYCIHFPGNPTGSETICEGDSYGGYYNQRFVYLEWGREFYEHIYKVYGVLKNFFLYCEDQANLVFFHEAGHLLHCSQGLKKSRLEREKEACTFEREWRRQFKNIFYFKEFVNAPWLKTMEYIEGLR